MTTHGIALPAGTLAGGLQRIAPILEPLYQAFFGPDAEGILNADRASNYKALTAVKEGTLLLASGLSIAGLAEGRWRLERCELPCGVVAQARRRLVDLTAAAAQEQ